MPATFEADERPGNRVFPQSRQAFEVARLSVDLGAKQRGGAGDDLLALFRGETRTLTCDSLEGGFGRFCGWHRLSSFCWRWGIRHVGGYRSKRNQSPCLGDVDRAGLPAF